MIDLHVALSNVNFVSGRHRERRLFEGVVYSTVVFNQVNMVLP